MDNKLVSVIIPTYSRPDNLCRAIDSVLNQTYSPIEIIVVDDNGLGSQYQIETEQALLKYLNNNQIVYLKHEFNKNGSAARNTGLCFSHGDYINFLDDDDVFVDNKIELQINQLESVDNSYGASYCNSIIYGTKRTIVTKNNLDGNLCQQLLSGKINFNTSTVIFRRNAIESINGFDETFRRHQDWETMARFFQMFKICLVDFPKPLLCKYSTPNLVSKNPQNAIEYRLFFLNKMKNIIDSQPCPRAIYKFQMEDLSIGLFKNGLLSDGFRFYLEIFKYGIPRFASLIKIIYYSLSNLL